jgi:hypothetical protein
MLQWDVILFPTNLQEEKMKRYRLFLALSMLVLAALACQTVLGGGKAPSAPPAEQPQKVQPTQAEALPAPTEMPTPESAGPGTTVSTKFPLPTDATNFMDLGEGGINFQTKMSLKDAVAFYRDAFSKQGLKEREITTTISDTVFSIVFDGHPSGKAVVVQGVDLGGGVLNINIRFEDI